MLVLNQLAREFIMLCQNRSQKSGRQIDCVMLLDYQRCSALNI